MRTEFKSVRSDHIYYPIRLIGHSKNIATSVILFPLIIFFFSFFLTFFFFFFFNTEKRILEHRLNLSCFFLKEWWKRLVFIGFIFFSANGSKNEQGKEKKKLPGNTINMYKRKLSHLGPVKINLYFFK